MVAIKDFGMPSCCSFCDFCVEDKYADMTCVLLGSEWEETDYNENHRDENCPLVEIEESKVGKWEYKQLGFRAYGVVCTNCGYVIHQGYDFTSMEEFKDMVERKLQDPHITMDKFCCKCGAEMRGVENG